MVPAGLTAGFDMRDVLSELLDQRRSSATAPGAEFQGEKPSQPRNQPLKVAGGIDSLYPLGAQ
jgi:hypothetical protein